MKEKQPQEQEYLKIAEFERLYKALVSLIGKNDKTLELRINAILDAANKDFDNIKNKHKDNVAAIDQVKKYFADEVSKLQHDIDHLNEKNTDKPQKGDKGDVGPKGADGYTPVKNVDYFDGKKGNDGSSDTAEDIIEKLRSLPPDKRLDKTFVRGYEQFTTQMQLDYAISKLRNQVSFLINKIDDLGTGGTAFDSHRPTTRIGIPVVTANQDDVVGFLETYFFPPASPSIVLATTPAGGFRETGDISGLTSIDLNVTTTKGADDITKVEYYRDGSLIYTDNSPIPGGGSEPTFTDTIPITTTTVYVCKVYAGTFIVDSNTVTFSFGFAYYYGSDGIGDDISTDGGTLTKSVIPNTPTLAELFSPTLQAYDFAYDASYPALVSIKDPSNFETISDYTVTTVTITNSFGQSASYQRYQLNHITSTTGFKNTFIQ